MKLLSFGEIVWDIFGNERALGGAPLNFAAHAALQGCEAWILSAVGADALGAEAISRIDTLGVRTDYLSVLPQKQSGQCIVSLHESGIPSYQLLEDMACDWIQTPELFSTDFDVLAFGTLALRSEHNREAIRRTIAQAHCAEIYTDLNIRPPFYFQSTVELCLSNATIAKISEEELPTVTELLYQRELPYEQALPALAKRYRQIKLILLTMGEKGSLCYDCTSGRIDFCPAEPVAAISTVGAGDSFGATFLTHYLKTRDVPSSLHIASKVSAHVVSRQEAVPPDMEDFLKSIPHP